MSDRISYTERRYWHKHILEKVREIEGARAKEQQHERAGRIATNPELRAAWNELLSIDRKISSLESKRDELLKPFYKVWKKHVTRDGWISTPEVGDDLIESIMEKTKPRRVESLARKYAEEALALGAPEELKALLKKVTKFCDQA